MRTKYWLENLKGKDHSEDVGVEGRVMLECIIGKYGEVWTGVVWLRIRTNGGFLLTQ
jgi:hypothetical protein